MIISNIKRKINFLNNYTVTVTGGLGAQIFSLAILNHYNNLNMNVNLNVSYFNKKLPHWDWSLDYFGYDINDFKSNKKNYITIADSPYKFCEAVKALSEDQAPNWFKYSESDLNNLKIRYGDFSNEYSVVVHIRRGDYLKLNSLIIDSNKIYTTLKKFKIFFNKIYILTDSNEQEVFELKNKLNVTFEEVILLDSSIISDIESHIIMRSAFNLISANSQFSISAALLNNNNGLIFLPSSIVLKENCPYGNILINNNIKGLFFY